MNVPVRHHYLTRFYLSAWAGLGGKLVSFKRIGDKLVSDRVAPKHTGFEHNLYTVRALPAEQGAWLEHFFAKWIDGPASHVLTAFREGRTELTLEERMVWTKFLMAQSIRSPAKIADVRRAGIENLDRVLATHSHEWTAIKGDNPEATLREWTEKHEPALGEKIALTRIVPRHCTDPDIGQKILSMRWQMLTFRHPSLDLVTSDHPLLITHGLNSPECWLMMPLAPDKLFIATHGAALQITDVRAVIGDTNRELIRSASQRVWAKGLRHRRFVEKHLRKDDN